MTARRGVTLGTTLLLAVLVAALGLCLASASLGHLHLVSGNDRSTAALDLARSTMSTAIARLQSDHDQPEVQLNDGRGEGLLSFGTRADAWAIPRSLDNLTGDSSVPGLNGRPLPAYSSLLVAVGRSQGLERRVVALIHLPSFPYAAVSQGPLMAPRALLVGRAAATDPAGDIWPASLRANADLSLGSGSHIFGDVIASGDIQAPPTEVEVNGSLRPNQPQEPLTRLDLSLFDPAVLGRPSNSLSAVGPGRTLSGVNRASGGLEVLGDLVLQDALVFVQGDAVVRGSLTGTGLLVASGDLTVDGHGQMVASSRLGLACGGKLTILGRDQQSSVLRGTVYAEKGVRLEQVTVYGVVANLGEQPAEFDRCAVYYEEEAVRALGSTASPADSWDFFIYLDGAMGSQTDHQRLQALRLGSQLVRDGDGYSVVTCALNYAGNSSDVNPKPTRASLDEVARFMVQQAQVSGLTRDQVRTRLEQLVLSGSGGPAGPGLDIHLDPSKILPRADRFRVTLWEEP